MDRSPASPGDFRPVPLEGAFEKTDDQMIESSRAFYETVKTRRSVRDYSSQHVPVEVIKNCLLAAGTAPNGANHQPWRFVVVSDPETKRKIRQAAEAEEHEFYHRRATKSWLNDLAPLGTNEAKPFLETAPYLIAIFGEKGRPQADGTLAKNYYVDESVGIATGILVTALHEAGLATLTHTPSPMGFLNEVLQRPKHEKPFLLLVVGKPADGAMVPSITKKSLDQIASFI